MDWLNFLKVMPIEERAARDKYQVAVDLADGPVIRAVFERLRDEEAFHADFLQGDYARLEQTLSSKD